MDVRNYLRVARAAWAVLLAGLLLGAVAAFGVSELLPKQYTATTQLFVSTTGADDLTAAVQGNYYAQAKVASYAQLATSKELATGVIDDLGLTMSPQELAGRLSATVVTDTTVLNISVTDGSPTQAFAIAQSFDRQFVDLVEQLETPKDKTASPIKITVIATPELPTASSSPAVRANTVLGALVGLVLAVAVAVVRDRLDTTVKDEAAVPALAGAPVIGHLPVADELTSAPQPQSVTSAAEAIRHVRTNLAFLDVDSPPRTILVTSSVPAEGKTTLSAHLAVALAESGNRVALVETDLRSPRLTRLLGLVAGAGVTSVLTGTARLDEVLQPVRDGRLQVLAAGPLPPNPSELLASEAFAGLLRELAATHDVVLLDAPPLLPVADAGALAGLVDGVLLCARWGTVHADELQRSSALLGRLGARLLGVVLTQVPRRMAPVAYGYGVQPDRRSWWHRRKRAAEQPAPMPAIRPRRVKHPVLQGDR